MLLYERIKLDTIARMHLKAPFSRGIFAHLDLDSSCYEYGRTTFDVFGDTANIFLSPELKIFSKGQLDFSE